MSPPSRRTLPSRRSLLEAAALLGVALLLRLLAAWALGEGAPFGPDGTGAEAAVHLGGHLYDLHIWLIAAVGSARTLSILSSSLSCLLLWVIGRQTGLGGGGGWLFAVLPPGVYTGALSAGDAPALAMLLLGVAIATAPSRIAAVVGGAIAATSIAIKPIALPAAALLLLRPLSLLGFGLALLPLRGWLQPLIAPRPHSGLLGSWWQASGGQPPVMPDDWLRLLVDGAWALASAPAWTLAPLLLLPLLTAALHRKRLPVWTHFFSGVPLLAGLSIAMAFGDRLEPRYLAAVVAIALPWVGRLLPGRWLVLPVLLLLWPTAAVITQVSAERATRDPQAQVPALPVVAVPAVDAAALFDEASTDDATALRALAAELAESLPPGATLRVRRRPHGREGELLWPLQVARPDLRIERVDDQSGL